MGIETWSGSEVVREDSEPWEMTFGEFKKEYDEIMASVASREKKGALDPAGSNYRVISDEERALLEKDWKEFSRSRGFSEEDIKEYERWLVLSGQRDGLAYAINDPWRRDRPDHAAYLYRKHIENALDRGVAISHRVNDSLQSLEQQPKGAERAGDAIPVPSVTNSPGDVW